MKGHLTDISKTSETDFKLRDIVSISDFSRQDIELVLEQAALMERMPREKKLELLRGKVVASLFFEPSTRTRLSFETSIQNLGASVIGFSDANTSSTKKGETLSDTIRMVSAYADIIVMRHYIEGAARRAAEISKCNIVNAGDGSNQHPTQTLLDLYTIRKEFRKIDGLSIGMLGDLKYGRTVHSLAFALSLFKGIKLYLIAPEQLKMPSYVLEQVDGKLEISASERLEDFLPELDVLYATRIQKERFVDASEYEKLKHIFILQKSMLSKAKEGLRIMHPLPRIDEISTDLDETRAALYFNQAANGIPVREALLCMLSKNSKGAKA